MKKKRRFQNFPLATEVNQPDLPRILIADSFSELVFILNDLYRVSPLRFSFAGWVKNGQQVVQRVEETKPHVLLMDAVIQEADAVEVARIVKNQYPETGIVIHSQYLFPELRNKFSAVGVSGFVDEHCSLGQWEAALQHGLANQPYREFIIDETNSLSKTRYLDRQFDLSASDYNFLSMIEGGNTEEEIDAILYNAEKSRKHYRYCGWAHRTKNGIMRVNNYAGFANTLYEIFIKLKLCCASDYDAFLKEWNLQLTETGESARKINIDEVFFRSLDETYTYAQQLALFQDWAKVPNNS